MTNLSERELLPSMQRLQAKLEQLKKNLEHRYSPKLIDRACLGNFQQALRQNPAVMFPSKAAITYYQSLCNPRHLESVVLEHLREHLVSKVIEAGLASDKATSAIDMVLNMRQKKLLECAKPGTLMEMLNQKKFFDTEIKKHPNLNKKVRFSV